VVFAITLLVWVSNGRLSRLVGVPWYRSAVRLSFNYAFFVPLFAGVALAAVTAAGVRAFETRAPIARLVVPLVVLAVFAIAIGRNAYDTSTRLLRSSFSHDARVTSETEAAFTWLHDHAGRGDVIVNDVNADGSLWMYARRRLEPLFAIDPVFSDKATERDWNDRLSLIEHIDELGNHGRTDALVRRYHARYVYFDERVFNLFRHRMKLDALESNAHLRPVFERGTVHVFEITDV